MNSKSLYISALLIASILASEAPISSEDEGQATRSQSPAESSTSGEGEVAATGWNFLGPFKSFFGLLTEPESESSDHEQDSEEPSHEDADHGRVPEENKAEQREPPQVTDEPLANNEDEKVAVPWTFWGAFKSIAGGYINPNQGLEDILETESESESSDHEQNQDEHKDMNKDEEPKAVTKTENQVEEPEKHAEKNEVQNAADGQDQCEVRPAVVNIEKADEDKPLEHQMEDVANNNPATNPNAEAFVESGDSDEDANEALKQAATNIRPLQQAIPEIPEQQNRPATLVNPESDNKKVIPVVEVKEKVEEKPEAKEEEKPKVEIPAEEQKPEVNEAKPEGEGEKADAEEQKPEVNEAKPEGEGEKADADEEKPEGEAGKKDSKSEASEENSVEQSDENSVQESAEQSDENSVEESAEQSEEKDGQENNDQKVKKVTGRYVAVSSSSWSDDEPSITRRKSTISAPKVEPVKATTVTPIVGGENSATRFGVSVASVLAVAAVLLL